MQRVGLDAVREDTEKIKDIAFKPSGSTDVSEPKYGKEDPKDEEHSGGNTWAGGVSCHSSLCVWYIRLFYPHRRGAEIRLVLAVEVVTCGCSRVTISNKCVLFFFFVSADTLSLCIP